jgi:hypothetical protein
VAPSGSGARGHDEPGDEPCGEDENGDRPPQLASSSAAPSLTEQRVGVDGLAISEGFGSGHVLSSVRLLELLWLVP